MTVHAVAGAAGADAYTIEPAQPGDVPRLAAIELTAARLLVGHAPPSVLGETTPVLELVRARRAGRLWVALAQGRPVGFAHVKMLEARVAHLEEIDVLPAHGRRGLGTRLVAAVCEWAARGGCEWVTLTTFRDVPWNMPFYSRLGFVEIPEADRPVGMRAIMEDEARRGLDPARPSRL